MRQLHRAGGRQGGQILAATALLDKNPKPEDADIDKAMSEVICRCGTYPRIRKAVKLAADHVSDEGGESRAPVEKRLAGWTAVPS